MNNSSKGVRLLLAGFIFSILWPSASTATKLGLAFAQPFVLFVTRFFVAAAIMLAIAHLMLKQPLPSRSLMKKLGIYGLLNIAVYLGLYVVAMQYSSAGIGSLFIATNPIFISLMTAIWVKQPVKWPTFLSLAICSLGILVAAYPLLQESYVTPLGLILLLAAMLSYSVSSIYFARQHWGNMHILTINGWQTLFGGLLLLPLLMLTYDGSKNDFTPSMVASVLWLAIPVSIIAVQLWLYLLKKDTVKASFWLFLCPVFGFIIAAALVGEPLTWYTLAGVVMVLAGLYLVWFFPQRSHGKAKK